MTRVLRDERGMALAVAIFALVVAGALIAGAFFAGTQEQRVGQNSLRVQQSFGVGEAAQSARARRSAISPRLVVCAAIAFTP